MTQDSGLSRLLNVRLKNVTTGAKPVFRVAPRFPADDEGG